MRRAFLCVALLGLTPLMAAAETLVEAYGLGDAEPVPEEWTKINEELSIRARIVDAATDEVVFDVATGQKLALSLDFYVQPGAADRDIRLSCGHFFYNPDGEQKGKEVSAVPCYSGKLSEGAETFQPLSYRYEFTMGKTAAQGTWALIAQVRDEVINDGIALNPTFRVGGGP